MTATERKIDRMMNGIEKIEMEELMILVHDSYFMEYWETAELELECKMDEETRTFYWKITDYGNDKTYEASSPRECYEIIYREILEHSFMEQLKKEKDEEAENEYLEEMETRNSFDKWYGNNNGVGYGRY